MEDRNDLRQILSEIDAALTRCTRQPEPQLLYADKWVLASGLQKAIRRGELRTAQSCAATLMQVDKQMLWRRLQVTALEDVGVGDAALVTQIIAAAAHANWRNQAGGDAKVVSYLVDRMCAAPKDRSADYLLYAAQLHPDHRDDRERLAGADIGELLDTVRDRSLPLPLRCVATWYAAGTDRFPGPGLEKRPGDLEAVFAVFADMGTPKSLLDACRAATRKIRDPLHIFVPLVWSEFVGSKSVVELVEIGPAREVRGVPTYALDMHTRLGLSALRLFLKSSETVQSYLERHAQQASRQKAVNVAVFYAESAALRRRCVWDIGVRLQAIGVEADLAGVNVGSEAVEGLIQVVNENLGHLDEIRVGLLEGPKEPEDLFSAAAS